MDRRTSESKRRPRQNCGENVTAGLLVENRIRRKTVEGHCVQADWPRSTIRILAEIVEASTDILAQPLPTVDRRLVYHVSGRRMVQTGGCPRRDSQD